MLLGYILLLPGLILFFLTIKVFVKDIQKRNREKNYKRCECGGILSEWFADNEGFMRCYSCGKPSGYTSHMPG